MCIVSSRFCAWAFSCFVCGWEILIDAHLLLCLSQLPSALITALGFMKPRGWSTAKLCGPSTAGLHWHPSSPLSHPPPPPEKTKHFHLSTVVNAGSCQGRKSPGKTEWKCAQAAGLEHDNRQADELFLPHAALHADQMTVLLEGLAKPFYEDHIHSVFQHW